MIYYNRFQSISYSEAPQMLNFTANFNGSREVNFTEAAQNFIRVRDSTFHNTGFHQVI